MRKKRETADSLEIFEATYESVEQKEVAVVCVVILVTVIVLYSTLHVDFEDDTSTGFVEESVRVLELEPFVGSFVEFREDDFGATWLFGVDVDDDDWNLLLVFDDCRES
jgi:hypothetical protein